MYGAKYPIISLLLDFLDIAFNFNVVLTFAFVLFPLFSYLPLLYCLLLRFPVLSMNFLKNWIQLIN